MIKPNKLKNKFIEMPIIEKAHIFSQGLNWVSRLIPCQELVSLIQTSITIITDSINLAKGITDIVRGAKQNNTVLILLGVLNVIINSIDIGINIKRQINKDKKKQLTKSQNNFNLLLSEMIKMFKKLLESNLADLYENNIIIVAIDEKETHIIQSNEGVALRLVNIGELYDYAKCLNHNDIEREKYIQNNIIFLKKVLQKISNLNVVPQFKEDEKDKKIENKKFEEKQEKEYFSNIQKAIGFLLTTQKQIKENPNYNNKKFWINTNEDSLDKILNDLYNFTLKVYIETNDKNEK